MAIGLIAFLGGCQFYFYHQVLVTVEHKTSGMPASSIRIEAIHLNAQMLNPPRDARGFTDESGEVVLRLADFRGYGIDIEVDGHLDNLGFTMNDEGHRITREMVLHGGTAVYRGPSYARPEQEFIVRITPIDD